VNNDVISFLCSADVTLGAVIGRVGPCGLAPDRQRTPFQGLVQAVAHQQLNGTAAGTILKRFRGLFAHGRFPTPQEVLELEPMRLTGVGFSRAKASYIQGIARSALDGIVPTRKQIEAMTDDEIVARLTQIKGIGRWSVEMFLIFGLGRPDVLPVHDFGIQSGFKLAYGKRKHPKPEHILKHGERWRPYRTTAAWYLWRAADLANKSKQPLAI
jgi:DNA-3-methyladenine glycosylase II